MQTNNHADDHVSYKRKQILVIPKMQLTLIAASIGIFIFSSVIFFATLNIVFMKMHMLGINLGYAPDSQYFSEIKELEAVTSKIYGLTVLLGILITYFGGLKLSHKIAGPIYYLNKQIKSICNNENMNGVKFRKGDFLLELQDNFNLLMKKFRETCKNEKEEK